MKGDATSPQTENTAIIAHICNDIGAWGAGFVLAITKRWPQPEACYRGWHAGEYEPPFELGEVQLVQVESDLWVANMIGQRGLLGDGNTIPLKYDAVGTALENLANMAVDLDAEVHMPRIGCGLAGGSWSRIEPLIQRSLDKVDVRVFVYDFEG